MIKAVDTFEIDINIHHQTVLPEEITARLNLQPWIMLPKGEFGGIARRSYWWGCHFREGLSNEAFDQALSDLQSILEREAPYFKMLRESGGDLEIAVSQSVLNDIGVIFNLMMSSEILLSLGLVGFDLRVQARSDTEVASH